MRFESLDPIRTIKLNIVGDDIYNELRREIWSSGMTQRSDAELHIQALGKIWIAIEMQDKEVTLYKYQKEKE